MKHCLKSKKNGIFATLATTIFAGFVCATATGALQGCSFIGSMTDDHQEDIGLSFDKTKSEILVGQMDALNLKATASQNSASIEWSFDDSIIMARCDNYGAVITGIKPGTTTLTARSGRATTTCVVTVGDDLYAAAIANPYVYASEDYIEVSAGSTKKISAALFGGTAGDTSGFSWIIDKPSVAGISVEGNYCWVTGITEGFARVTARHQKAANSYSVLVNCTNDGTTFPYISTESNVITINTSEDTAANFTVTLENPPSSDWENSFTFSIVNADGSATSNPPCVVESASSNFVTIRAQKPTGECCVRCIHPYASYQLDILVRIVENAETAFINPSETTVTISGDEKKSVSVSLENYSGEFDASKLSWEFSSGYDEYLSYELLNGDGTTTGDWATFSGKKTGSARATISYPGLGSRTIIILVRNIASEAASATTYITTSQNYIRVEEGSEAVRVNAYLTDCAPGDTKDILWTVTHCASDGSGDVIKWLNGTGKAKSARSLSYSENAYCVIEPLKEGTAYIDVSHPKAIYPTRITVRVTKKGGAPVKKAYLSLKGSPVVKVKNGEMGEANITLEGNGNESEIVWSAPNSGNATISAIGNKCAITAPSSGSGGSRFDLTASHPNADSAVTFAVICYDTDDDLNSLIPPTIYTTTAHETLDVGQSARLYLWAEGFDNEPQINWEIVSGKNVVSLESESNTVMKATAISGGKATIRASCADCSAVNFAITVKQEGVVNEDAACYLSTSQNTVYLERKGSSSEISVTMHNIRDSFKSNAVWTISNNEDFELSANGDNASVTALSDSASAILTVTHPLSENTLEIFIKCGSQYVYKNEDVCYVTVEKNNLEFFAGQDEETLYASLVHTEENSSAGTPRGFKFESDDTSVAEVSYTTLSNFCYIKPVSQGVCKITVTHDDAKYGAEVVVVVRKAATSNDIPYITTKTNVLTLVEGDYSAVSVSIENGAANAPPSLWKWESDDVKTASVVANNGETAMICANKSGSTTLKVSRSDCAYSLKIIVVVLGSAATSSRPYINSSESIITLQKGKSATVTAEMIGGAGESDSAFFNWSSSSSRTALVTPSGSSCFIKAMETGLATITVKNSRYPDSYPRTVLVVVEDDAKDGVYIKPSQSIIKIKPDDTSLTVITAELMNGEATDAQDFIWWADDYNLIGMTSVAGQCSVSTTGRSGTTKIHAKHPKAEKQCDILVMVSSYDKFAFSASQAKVSTDSLDFFSLQVPAMEESFKVKYSSSNESVCIAQGSSQVAWVCGIAEGTANITATMVLNDGTEVARAEMLVSVSVPDPSLPTVSLGQSIITMEAGSSRTFAAIVSGDGIGESERYKLKWTIEKNSNYDPDGKWTEEQKKNAGISISATGQFLEEVTGPECYVTAKRGGEYIIRCTHAETGVSSSIWLIVEEKGEIGIELSSNIETVYKDDGSFTLTAELTNATESDYKTIEWSAVKIGGANIVSVSKTKGKTCTVIPKEVGQTQVVAKIPNGKSAICVIIVKANAEISISTGTIRVIPGYTETVSYTTNPTNATVNWFTQFATSSTSLSGAVTNYFSIEDDTVKKQLRITGLVENQGGAAGTITGTMVGASSANLPKITVFVDYNVEIDLRAESGAPLGGYIDNNKNGAAGENHLTLNEEKFEIHYFPSDLVLDIASSKEDVVRIGSKYTETYSEPGSPDIIKGKCTVTLVPVKEGECDITVKGNLPSDKDGRYGVKESVRYQGFFSDYDVSLNTIFKEGSFSHYDEKNRILTLGDGEEVLFYFTINNKHHSIDLNASDQITVDWINTAGSTEYKKNPSGYKNLKGKSREELKKQFFENGFTGEASKNLSEKTNEGLIYCDKEESQTGTSTKFYKIAHMFDYYEDIPEDYDGSNISLKEHDFFKTHKDLANWESWLVSKELLYQGNNFTINHPDDMAKGGRTDFIQNHYFDWYHTTRHRSYNTWFCCKMHQYWSQLHGVFRNVETKKERSQLYWREGGGSGTDLEEQWNDNATLSYVDCNPYVITGRELQDNLLYCRPQDKQSVGYDKIKKFLNIGAFKVSDLSEQIKLNQIMHRYITPTISKDTNRAASGEIGTITIKIKRGGTTQVLDKTITVKIEKRNCEAYTKNSWTQRKVKTKYGQDGSYQRWYSGTTVLPDNFHYSRPNSLYIENPELSATYQEATSENLAVNYLVKPKNATITVTIPEYNGLRLSMNGATKVSEGVYRITNHTRTTPVDEDELENDCGYGTLRFVRPKGEYFSDAIKVNATGTNLSDTQNVRINIFSEEPQISIKDRKVSAYPNKSYETTFSSYKEDKITLGDGSDFDKRLLILGDGETITLRITKENGDIDPNIKSIEFVSNNESEYVSATNGGKGTKSVYNGKIEWNITLSHSRDYGYFNYNGGSCDFLYDFDLTESDMAVDKTSAEYQTAYDAQSGKDWEKEQKAVAQVQKAMFERLKKTYLNNTANLVTKNYQYYKNEDGKQIPAFTSRAIPVGNINIKSNDASTGEEIIDTIFVAVEIRNCPAVRDSTYGYLSN